MTDEYGRAADHVLGKTYTRRAVLKGTLAAGAGALAVSALGGGVFTHGVEASTSPSSPGAVYAMTNEATGNRVQAFNRGADGRLTAAGSFPTGGMGSASFEGSAGGLILAGQSPDNLGRGNRYLFATNTGSNEISVFVVQQDRLTLVDKVPSGGVQPVSLTLRKDVLYVLNQASGNINGFLLGAQGTLTPIPGSTRPVTGGGPADTAQVAFTPGGDVLVVTGKNTNIIDTYTVGADRVASGPVPNQATGVTPFGFAFTQRGQVIVAESFQGAMGQGAASSYEVPNTGVLVPISGPVRNNRSDTCWVVITDDNRYAYVANAQTGDVSSYRVAPDGTLALLAPIAGLTGPLTIDEALSQDSRYLYVRVLSDGTIRVFQVQEDGSLTPLQTIGGLPPGAIGLAAR